MAVETAKDKIKFHQIIGQKQEIITVDGDVIVNDVKPDILKVISTNGIICIYKKEILDGKIKMEGCINTYIIYLADDENGSIRTINTSLDFSKIVDMENCKEGMTLDETLGIRGFETKILNGRKLHVKAFLDANIKVCSNSDIETIVNIENEENDIQMLNCNKKVMSLIGENVGRTTLKETINVSDKDELAEIMNTSFCISDIKTKTSYNKVLIKANANVEIMYLTEDNRVSNVSTDIPLMGFIDLPNVSDTSECIARAKLKTLNLKPNNVEEHSIYIEADIELFCRAYESKEMNMIEDVYSTLNDVDLKRTTVRATTDQFNIKNIHTIKQNINAPELSYGRILGANINPMLENVDVRDNRINYEGKLSSEIIVSSDSNINGVNVEVPFNLEMSFDKIRKNSMVETEINIISRKIYNDDSGVILEVQIEVNTIIQNNEELNLAQEVTLMDPKKRDIYSMIIYFVRHGDTLWKIAKQFKSRVEDIARVNGIEDENKIYPGQQLYIPRFTRNRIAI